MKTLKSYVTTFCNDADNFTTYVLDSLGDFFAMGEGLMRPGFGGQEDLPAKAKKVFPRSQGKSDGWLTNQITRSIRNNISYANPNHFSARSLRIGPTTEMAISRFLSRMEQLGRGGWETGTNERHYTRITPALTIGPMRCLAGYSHPRKQTFCANLSILGTADFETALQLMREYYSPISIPEFLEGGSCSSLLRVIFATNLMWFEDKFNSLGGLRCETVRRMSEVVVRMRMADNISNAIKLINSWGRTNEKFWKDQNAAG